MLKTFFNSLTANEEFTKEKNYLWYFAFFVLLQAIAFSLTLLGEVTTSFGFSDIFLNRIITLGIVVVGYILGIIALSYLFTGLLSIYKETKQKKVFKVISLGLTLQYVITIALLFSEELSTFLFTDKPVVLVALILFNLYILHKGFKNLKIKSSHVTAALILAGVFIYILSLGKIDVIIFYAAVMSFVYYKRKKFDAQGAILLYKTKLGIKSMKQLAKKYPKAIHYLAQTGIYVGFLAMIFMCGLLIQNIYKLLTVPSTLPGVSPVLPGIPIPGSPLTLPLWYGIISIFITVVIHEFSHGVVSKVYKARVKSSGFLFMGPIIGAFVEPDEKQLKKRKHQLGVFAAGPFSNILTALLVIGILALAVAPAVSNVTEPAGAEIGIIENSTASRIGLQNGDVILKIDNTSTKNASKIFDVLDPTKPGETITIKTQNKTYNAVLGENPENESKGFLGITATQKYDFTPTAKERFGETLLNFLLIIERFLTWLFIISLGIGLANLIPLGPVDGGRMLLAMLEKYTTKEKAKEIWTRVSSLFILILLFVLFFPFLKWTLGQF